MHAAFDMAVFAGLTKANLTIIKPDETLLFEQQLHQPDAVTVHQHHCMQAAKGATG